MIPKTIEIGAAHTISTGNYENIKVNATITVDTTICKTDAEVDVMRAAAQVMLRELLRETYTAQRRQSKKDQQDA
jgi:thiamine biosynthesis protein ThiC